MIYFAIKKILYWVVGIWWRVILKVKITFCKYWTLIKIYINMAWVYKGDKVKIKMMQQQWSFYCVKIWKLLFNGGRGGGRGAVVKIWWSRESTKDEYFLVEKETMSKFLAGAGFLLFLCLSREIPVIWSQFGSGLQNLMSHDLL